MGSSSPLRRRPEEPLAPLEDFLSPFGPLDRDLDFEFWIVGCDDGEDFSDVAEFVVNCEEDERLLELERGGVWVVCCTLLEGYNTLPGSVDVDVIGLRW